MVIFMITQDRWKFPFHRAYAGVTPLSVTGWYLRHVLLPLSEFLVLCRTAPRVVQRLKMLPVLRLGVPWVWVLGWHCWYNSGGAEGIQLSICFALATLIVTLAGIRGKIILVPLIEKRPYYLSQWSCVSFTSCRHCCILAVRLHDGVLRKLWPPHVSFPPLKTGDILCTPSLQHAMGNLGFSSSYEIPQTHTHPHKTNKQKRN